MDSLIPWIIALLVCLTIGIAIIAKLTKFTRLHFIENYDFNKALIKKLREHYSHLTDNEVALVLAGLRDYYRFCSIADRRMISMPSKVVDVALHEMILFTREYSNFCQRAFGKFLHHTPAEAMASKTHAQDGIKRVWRLACAHEGIDPRNPHKLPRLFALDEKLAIEDGYFYTLKEEAKKQNRTGNSRDDDAVFFYAVNIGCGGGCAANGCGGGSCCGDSGGGDGGGCGGGCGGD